MKVARGAVLALFCLFHRGQRGSIARRERPWLAGAVLLGGVLGPILLMAGLRSTPAAAGSLLLNLELLFREPFDPALAVAGLLMAGGVWLHLSERHQHEHRHERLAHTHSHVHDEHHRHAHAAGVDPRAPHTHAHEHEPMTHVDPHYPDIHHRHRH